VQTPAARADQHDSWLWVAATLVFAPFALKRLLELGEHGYVYWLAVDYGGHLVSLAGAFVAYRRGLLSPPRQSVGPLGSLVLTPVFLAVALAQIGAWDPSVAKQLSVFTLSHYPHIGNASLKTIDLTLGLALVAVSQEVAFRRILFDLLGRRISDRAIIVVMSSITFGLYHVTYGVDHFAVASIYGLLFGTLYALTGRVWTCVAVHYVIDLRYFLSM